MAGYRGQELPVLACRQCMHCKKFQGAVASQGLPTRAFEKGCNSACACRVCCHRQAGRLRCRCIGCNSWIPPAKRPPRRRLCMRSAKPLRVRLAAGRADAKAQRNANAMPVVTPRLLPKSLHAFWRHATIAPALLSLLQLVKAAASPATTHARMARTHSAGINASTARKNTPTSTSIAAVRGCR